MKKLLVLTVLLAVLSLPLMADETITLQPATTKQTFVGWWGVLAPTSVGTDPADIIPAATNSLILDALVEMGMTGGRITIHQQWVNSFNGFEDTNDNADPNDIDTTVFYPQFRSTYTTPGGRIFDPDLLWPNVILPLKTRVEARGDTFSTYVSIGGAETDFQSFWLLNTPDCNNGNEEEFAEFVEAYWQWLEADYGYTPTYFSPHNEPTTGMYDDCTAPGTRQFAEMAQAAATRLQVRWPATTLILEENITPADIWKFDSCGNDIDCKALIGLVSYHGYDYNASNVLDSGDVTNRNVRRDRAATLGVASAMTEICCQVTPVSWDGSYAHGLALARDIFWNMTEADATAWMEFGSVNVCASAGCPTGGSTYIIVEPVTFDDFYLLPVYWAIRQFANWIRPGMIRVDTSCSGCTAEPTTGNTAKVVAFKRPDNTYVIVAINDRSVSTTMTFADFPLGQWNYEGIHTGICTGGSGVRNRCTPDTGTKVGTASWDFTMVAEAIDTFSQAPASTSGAVIQGAVTISGAVVVQ